MKTMKLQIKWLIIAFVLLISQPIHILAIHYQKREFRGAWIQCVNGQFLEMTPKQMQDTLTYQLDCLKADGINAIIFQVRAECDALYKSNYEPWSRFLTGRQGQAPSTNWDPLAWIVDQCHKRGMEIHAWINPFRAKTKTTHKLAANHIAVTHPDRVFAYDGLYVLNPGLPQNRDYICDIVKDIVARYDIDGLHIDDYFYPYPAAGQAINDAKEFAAYNNGIKDINDWRRYNVNLFIEQLYKTVHQTKPWVKVGISPFGIYRNKKNAPQIGSNTSGLQNYDDLYADVLLWVNNGWLDYCVPQLYWQIGHKAADYETLIKWWNRYCGKRLLYIGEDVERSVKFPDINRPETHQMSAKFALRSQMANVKGAVLWYAKAVVNNVGYYGTMLKDYYWKYPALQPKMSYIDGKAPKKVRRMKVLPMDGSAVLFWTAPKGTNWKNQAVKYVVYKFEHGEKIDIDNPTKIVDITANTFYKIPISKIGNHTSYVVTALDRLNNESKVRKIIVK